MAAIVVGYYPSVYVTRRSHNFAPFVRQTGEGKAQTCAMAIYAKYKLGTAGLAMQSLAKKPEAGAATKAEDE
jgi:hypothetical protein